MSFACQIEPFRQLSLWEIDQKRESARRLGLIFKKTLGNCVIGAAKSVVCGFCMLSGVIKSIPMSDPATGTRLAVIPNPTLGVQCLGDKRTVAALVGGMSTRWVDSQIAQGMPHLKLGKRRVRFDLVEVSEWLRKRYSQRIRNRNARTAKAA